MDQTTRNKLRSVVTQCRRLLEVSIAQQLQGKYDIYATGKKDEVRAEKDVPQSHLSDEESEARRDILAHFDHVEALGSKPREALEQLIREIAFTHLNRLCAYKMMEVRDVYVGGQKFREAVSKGLKSQGFLFYLAENPEEEKRYNAGHQEEAYRHFLNWLGGTLSQEIGVLFSPNDPANRVYPPQRVLDEVLDLLNSEELKGVWSEDETIGWVYQYFTPKELRDAARDTKRGGSQAPRNSYELAFRNQFFTPRYVVEFLTDNTLGRIWYEMRRGNTRLREECRYLVRLPGEIFFSEQENEPGSPVRAMKDLLLGGTEETFPPFRVGETQRLVELAHTVDGYERHPFGDQVEGEWWPWAMLREIREAGDLSRFPAQDLLDVLFCQARADRHGGGYGDWEETFYEIANEVRRRAIEGRTEDTSHEQLLRAITTVAQRVKKDPREIKILDPACGSGHFLLYCFALLLVIYEEAYDDPELGLRLQADYPTKDDLQKAVPGLILRHNLYGIDNDLRCTQIAALALWLRCQRAYQEQGLKKGRSPITRSNIVCAEPMPGERYMLKEFMSQVQPKLLGQLVEGVFENMGLAGEAGSLLKIEDAIRDAITKARLQWAVGPAVSQMTLFEDEEAIRSQRQFDFSGITDSKFFEHAETKVIDTLRRYAESAQNGQRTQRRLFADDAIQGFAFVDISHKKFDVLLMNPPFGLTTRTVYEWLVSAYPEAYSDLAAAFMALMSRFCEPQGMLGAITTRSFLQSSDLGKFRQTLFLPYVKTLVDLGPGVMDEAWVEASMQIISMGACAPPFLVVDRRQKNDRDRQEPVRLPHTEDRPKELLYVANRNKFLHIPKCRIAYDGGASISALITSDERLKPKRILSTTGLRTFDDERFYRLRWEIKPENIGKDKTWCDIARNAPFACYYAPSTILVKWDVDGHELADKNREVNGQTAQARQSSRYYFVPGLCFSRRSEPTFSVRVHPADCSFSSNTGVVLAKPGVSILYLAGLLNSTPFRAAFKLLANKYSYTSGHVESLAWSEPDNESAAIVSANAEKSIRLRMSMESRLEIDPYFAGLGIASSDVSISMAANRESRRMMAAAQEVIECGERIDEQIMSLYGLDVSATELKEKYRSSVRDLPRPDAPLYVDAKMWTADLLSFAVGCVFGRWDIRRAFCNHESSVNYDPFAPIPSCPPASLKMPDGLPAVVVPPDYPLTIELGGTIVDDPESEQDLVRLVRKALEHLWQDRSEVIELEACNYLVVKNLQEYFRKSGPGGFWVDHLERYSRKPREAPLYWLLQSSKKNFALWIYYHRLDKDLLFKALQDSGPIQPKINRLVSRVGELRERRAAVSDDKKAIKKLDGAIEAQETLLSELRDFEDKLRRAANLHLDPDLNDGVVLNIAPLHELVPWKEAKSTWDDLMDGKYEWSSIGKQLREKGLVL